MQLLNNLDKLNRGDHGIFLLCHYVKGNMDSWQILKNGKKSYAVLMNRTALSNNSVSVHRKFVILKTAKIAMRNVKLYELNDTECAHLMMREI